jgi:transposase
MFQGKVQVPAGFVCPYKDACPELEGLSTHWVWHAYESAPQERGELWAMIEERDQELRAARKRIKELEREKDELKARYQALHRKQFKAQKKPSDYQAAKIQDWPKRNKRKRGAPVGHSGWYRPRPTRIDRTEEITVPQICPYCGGEDLQDTTKVKEYLQEDIVVKPQVVVTRFRYHQAYCRTCQRTVVRKTERGGLPAPIGPVAKSLAVYLRHELRLPFRKVQSVLVDVFGLRFVPASAWGFERQAAKRGRALYDDLREKVRASKVVYADETHWRQDGKNHYVWFAGNEDLAYYHIDRHRSLEAARAVLGENFDGNLISDGYSLYYSIGVRLHQVCLAHLIITAKELWQELKLRTRRYRAAEIFCRDTMALLKKACSYNAKHISRSYGFRLRRRFLAELDQICARTIHDARIEHFRQRLLTRERTHLFTFLIHPDIQPTNNLAERSLRDIVVLRKIVGGTRSPTGSFTLAIIHSLFFTARRQGRDPRKFLHTLFSANIPAAYRSLYNDSS